VASRLADRLQASAHAVAQGVVPIPQGVSASTAHAITSGSLNAFTSGLDTALLIAAAIEVTVGVAAFASVRTGPRTTGASSPARAAPSHAAEADAVLPPASYKRMRDIAAYDADQLIVSAHPVPPAARAHPGHDNRQVDR
jgi:hypothetical protein